MSKSDFENEKWFAWFPVKTNKGWVWFETIERVLEWADFENPSMAYMKWVYYK